MTTLDQRQFDALYTWLQGPQQCHARPTKSGGWRYKCNHTFVHTATWLGQEGLSVESHLAHLQARGIGCDCGILSTLTDWPS